jgi:selenocysteine lyase/cysteine desulfurase
MPGIHVYGDANPAASDTRLGVIPFNVEEVDHYLVAAILGYEGGVGVRSGCFCAHPYVVHLLQLPREALEAWKDLEAWKERVLRGDKRGMPGMVRASFGCYSDTEDVDRLVEMLDRVARGDYHGKYEVDPASGEYLPEGYREPLARFFTLESASD